MSEVYKRKVYFCGGDCIESFRTTRINPDFKKLPIQNFYSTAAPNSGPLALLYRKYYSKQLKLPEKYDGSVLFFNCKGDLLRMVAFELKERVVLFQFTQQEELLIMYANGMYFLIDPATANVTQGCIFPQEDLKNVKNRVFGAQLVGGKVIAMRERSLGVVDKLGALWRAFPAVKLSLDNPVFSGSVNQQGDLEIAYLSSAGIIELFNIKKWQDGSSPPITLYSNPALKSNLPNLVTLTKQHDRIGLIFTDRAILARINSGTLVFPFNEFKIQKEDPVAKSQSKSKYRNFYQLGFIHQTLFFYDRVRLLFLSLTEPQYEIRSLSLTSLLSHSTIGVRLLDEHTFVFRVISNAMYFSLVENEDMAARILKFQNKQQQEEYEHYRQLSKAYDNFMEKKPIELNQLHKLGQHVGDVWKAVVETASLFIDPGEQLMALKFANFLQNYFRFNQKSHRMESLSKQLRVVNNLRHQYLNRWLVYEQFTALKAGEQFLLLLLRYNMHFVADMIYEDSKSKEKIFEHWARCKIQKETESTALEEIRNRYQKMKIAIGPTYVFTDLARYCLDSADKGRDMTNLALQLIQLEPHPARRCIVFLFIFLSKKQPQTVDKLLEFAQQSNNASTIHQTIQSLRKVSQDWLPAKAWQGILPKKPMLEYDYIKTLRCNNDLQELSEYLKNNGLFVEMSYISLGKELEKLKEPSLETVKQLVSRDYGKVLSSLSDQLEKCSRRSGVDALRELKAKKYPITEEDSNCLTKDGEFQVLAEMVIRKDNNLPLAARILRKVKSDKVYSLLLRKGKVKDAIEQAFTRKNKEKMLELLPLADEQMQALGRQLYEQLLKTR